MHNFQPGSRLCVHPDDGGAQGQIQAEASGQGCVRGELQWPEFSHRLPLPWGHAAVEPAQTPPHEALQVGLGRRAGPGGEGRHQDCRYGGFLFLLFILTGAGPGRSGLLVSVPSWAQSCFLHVFVFFLLLFPDCTIVHHCCSKLLCCLVPLHVILSVLHSYCHTPLWHCDIYSHLCSQVYFKVMGLFDNHVYQDSKTRCTCIQLDPIWAAANPWWVGF